MMVFVFIKAWPSFAHNGLAWFGSGGNVDQQLGDIFNSPANPDDYVYQLRAWPLLWGTFADHDRRRRAAASSISLLAAIFIVEFAPAAGHGRCSSRSCGCWRPCRRSSTG